MDEVLNHTKMRLRLAAFSGHCKLDSIAARRSALVEILAADGPHPKSEILESLEETLGPCWGKRPNEALQRDIYALRLGGLRIGYSRRKGSEGYYLKHPALESELPNWQEPVSEVYLNAVRAMPIEQKLARTFSMAQFALNQRRLILKREDPERPDVEIDTEARAIVYGMVRDA